MSICSMPPRICCLPVEFHVVAGEVYLITAGCMSRLSMMLLALGFQIFLQLFVGFDQWTCLSPKLSGPIYIL